VRKTLIAAARLAIVVGAFVAVACGGDDGEPNAAEIYADAGKKMAALTSFHVSAKPGAAEEEQGSFQLDVAPPDKSHFSYTFIDETGDTAVYETIRIGDQSYQKGLFFDPSSEDWFETPEDLSGPAPDYTTFFSRLWIDVSDLTYVGEEDLDGVASHRLRGTITAELAMLFDPEEPAGGSITLELLVGKKDSLVHQLRRLKEGEESDALALSGFDEAINIEPPPGVLPATEFFKRLIEATPVEQQECIRSKVGDTAFNEVKTGERLPTAEEFALGDECSSD
jgi:hypothetical protein